MNRRIRDAVQLVVLAVWTVSFLADVALDRYQPPASVHAAMMAVVGAATAAAMRGRKEPPG